jgi:CRISPR-associated endonuclease Cas1
MQAKPTPARLAPAAGGVLVVDGYGVRIRVERGRLVISDGVGRARRVGQFERANSRLRRLVVLGHSGAITVDALRWLSDVGVGLTAIDSDGRVLAASAGMGRDDPRLRRAQAVAIDRPTGDRVAHGLIGEKIAAQADTLARLADLGIRDEAVVGLREGARRLHVAASRDELRLAEAQAAGGYWSAWTAVPVRFTRRDQSIVPAHWTTFGKRRSPITVTSRSAANPANAILNYLYAVLEAEARLACLAVGLDPGLGVLHSDLKARDSLALDVMEPVRPRVDGFLLDLLQREVFRARDFHETRQGVCRVLEPLSHRLAETAPTWAAWLGPVVERVAALLVAVEGSPRPQPTPLTGHHRSRGRSVPAAPRASAGRLTGCERCGERSGAGRHYCDACLPSVRAEQQKAARQAGSRRLASLRASGKAAGIGGDAARARGRKVADSRKAATAWASEAHPTEEAMSFRKDVLPYLEGMRANDVAALTGLSRPYCSAILRGDRVPHPRHWVALRATSGRQSETG